MTGIVLGIQMCIAPGKLFYELIEDWFRETTRSDTSRISRFCAAFQAGDTDTIQKMLDDYLWESISVR